MIEDSFVCSNKRKRSLRIVSTDETVEMANEGHNDKELTSDRSASGQSVRGQSTARLGLNRTAPKSHAGSKFWRNL